MFIQCLSHYISDSKLFQNPVDFDTVSQEYDNYFIDFGFVRDIRNDEIIASLKINEGHEIIYSNQDTIVTYKKGYIRNDKPYPGTLRRYTSFNKLEKETKILGSLSPNFDYLLSTEGNSIYRYDFDFISFQIGKKQKVSTDSLNIGNKIEMYRGGDNVFFEAICNGEEVQMFVNTQNNNLSTSK